MDKHCRTGCPVELALDLVGGKWKPLILYRLSGGTMRFAQLQRAMPGVTQRMLTLQLRELERAGLIRREVYPEVPPRVEYSITAAADGLLPILEALGHWAAGHQTRSAASTRDADTSTPYPRAA
ncbi:MAG TPA: helix-turn-helix domain-containing protein [Ramlibacter sp.]|nr:helix-turn-helix domain-containing protein [Ramlibacter sp.]